MIELDKLYQVKPKKMKLYNLDKNQIESAGVKQVVSRIIHLFYDKRGYQD